MGKQIKIKDFAWIFDKIIDVLKEAPKLYVSDVLHYIKEEEERSFKVLVATIISLRTKEKITWQVSEVFFKHIKCFQDILDCSLKQLEKYLYPCGFYRQKAKQLQQTAELILSKFKGRIPRNFDQLLALPGIGRKTANLVLIEAYNMDGICVDIHVHRILNRWKILQTKNPDETEMKLRQILPNKYWKIINKNLVLFGQNICKPVKPRCKECFLNENCPYDSNF